jgi:hypothetical protein
MRFIFRSSNLPFNEGSQIVTRIPFPPILLLAILVAGCSSKPPITRPAPGDTVVPQVKVPPGWETGGAVVMTVQLRVEGAEGTKSAWLTHEDVPLEQVPHAKLTFWNGEELVKAYDDVLLVPEC